MPKKTVSSIFVHFISFMVEANEKTSDLSILPSLYFSQFVHFIMMACCDELGRLVWLLMLNSRSLCRLRKGCWRCRGRKWVGGRLDRGRCHSSVGHLRGVGDGVQRLEQGEAVSGPPEPHWAGAEIYCCPWRASYPNPRGWDRCWWHSTSKIW